MTETLLGAAQAMSSHNSHLPASTLREIVLLKIMQRDCLVLAERAAAEAAAKKEEMRANMVARAALNRKLKSQSAVSPAITRRKRHAAN